MTKLLFQDGDISENNNISYQLLRNQLPKAMRRFLREMSEADKEWQDQFLQEEVDERVECDSEIMPTSDAGETH